MTVTGLGVSVGLGVFVGEICVAVAAGVGVAVLVGVFDGVDVSVGLGVRVGVGVAVRVGVDVEVAVGVALGVADGATVGEAVGTTATEVTVGAIPQAASSRRPNQNANHPITLGCFILLLVFRLLLRQLTACGATASVRNRVGQTSYRSGSEVIVNEARIGSW
jgi:hypothetical protein